MPTIRLIPSSYSVSSSNRVSVTNASNMYNNTDHTANYCSIRGRNSSSSTYYAFIKGFNFGDVPANATVNSFAIKIRCYKNSYLQQGTSYRPRLASSNSNSNVISGTTLSSDVTTTSAVYTFPIPSSLTWDTLKGYGANFSIEIPLRSSSNQYPYLYVYGAEIEVTYTESVAVTGVSLDQSTASVGVGSTVTLAATVSPSNATNKTVTWSSSNTDVATVSNGLVTGVAAGTATITVRTVDGGFTDSCTVTVTGGGAVWETIFDGYTQVIASSPNYIWQSGYTTPFQEGETYRVTWGNATYICNTFSHTASNCYDGYAIGNKAISSGQSSGSDEPFLLYRYDNNTLIGGTTSPVGTIYLKVEKLVGGGAPPVITVGIPSVSVISAKTGHDQCVCVFTSDLELSEWEARATKSGITPARGVGLLVESGTTLAAGATATIYVENEELTDGDGDYTITVYGKSTAGIWSE